LPISFSPAAMTSDRGADEVNRGAEPAGAAGAADAWTYRPDDAGRRSEDVVPSGLSRPSAATRRPPAAAAHLAELIERRGAGRWSCRRKRLATCSHALQRLVKLRPLALRLKKMIAF